MVGNTVKSSLKEVTNNMKNLDKKVSDGLKKNSDKLEALPGIVKRAVLAPH
jgi:hypothetical protein